MTTPGSMLGRMALWFIAAAVLVPVFLLGLSQLGFFPWSKLNCWTQEVDITTGSIRHTRYLLWMQTSQRIEETLVSKTAEASADSPQWHIANTFSPGVHNSPHYMFHGAVSQIRLLEIAWELGEFSEEARQVSARQLLQRWQKDGNDEGAKQVNVALSNLALTNSPVGTNELLPFIEAHPAFR